MSAGDPVTDIPLAVEVDYFRIAPTAYFVPVSVKVPGSVIGWRRRAARATRSSISRPDQDERTRVVGNVRDYIHQARPGQAVTPGQQELPLRRRLHARTGQVPHEVRGARKLTGKMGTFEMGFTVPDLSADTSGLKTSTIIWSSQREKVTAAVGSAERRDSQGLGRQSPDRGRLRK